jgi:hypothetical protein
MRHDGLIAPVRSGQTGGQIMGDEGDLRMGSAGVFQQSSTSVDAGYRCSGQA